MAVVYSLEQYRTLQQSRINKLKSLQRRGPITSAKYMAAQLRKMSPRGRMSHPSYSHMYQTIKRSKNSVSVSGVNKKNGFPYIHWVNATPGSGLESVRLFGKGKKVRYSQTRYTGVPGFYWIAQSRTRKFSLNSSITATRNILKSSF